jgi:3-methyladenine DNA glycosylase/8-oxoguanine DNA glycosylase
MTGTDLSTLDAWNGLTESLAKLPSSALQTASAAQAVCAQEADFDKACVWHRHMPGSELLLRERALRAMDALLGSSATLTNIADDHGFDTIASLDTALLQHFALTAWQIRRLPSELEFDLQLPATFRVEETLQYLGRDPASLAQRRSGERSVVAGVLVDARPATLTMSFTGSDSLVARCSLTFRGNPPKRAAVTAAHLAGRLLGLPSSANALQQRAQSEALIARLIGPRRGLRLPLTASPMDALTWSILGQQISLPFAYSLLRTCCELAGTRCPGGLRTMPSASRLADLTSASLTSRKFSRAKSEYLRSLAGQVVDSTLNLDTLASGSAPHAKAKLLAARGIGPWTANYVLMRGFGFADCAPIGDAGLRRALKRFLDLPSSPDDRAMEQHMEQFAPHRSLATYHLWRGSDNALD